MQIDNNKNKFKNKAQKRLHTATYSVSSFLSSKKCLDPVYNLNTYAVLILRYIADSIDKTYAKTKCFEAKLYLSQISKYCFCSKNSVIRSVKLLMDKNLLVHNSEFHTFKLGEVLITGLCERPALDRCLTETFDRRVPDRDLSYSSDFTNTVVTTEPQKPKSLKEKAQASAKAEESRRLIKELTKSIANSKKA
jgi:hypothetical protein